MNIAFSTNASGVTSATSQTIIVSPAVATQVAITERRR